MLVDILSAVVRALSFVAQFQAAGIVLFLALFDRHLAASLIPIRRIAVSSALAGALLVAAHYSLEAARMAGELAGVFDASLQSLVLHSDMSKASVLRASGLLLMAVGFASHSTRSRAAALLGAALVLIAFTLVGHTAVSEQRAWMAPLLLVHLLIVAFWFGALAPLYIVCARETTQLASALIERFSRIAAWLVPGIFIAGALLTWLLVPNWSVFTQPYGELLLVKIAAFAVLMGLATLNKWRYGPALLRDARAAISLRRVIAIEYALVVGVLAATALMTSFFSPEN